MVEIKDLFFMFVCFNICKIFLFKQVDAIDDRHCLVALDTMRIVKKCPLNLNEIKEASKRKKCNILAKTQNCTEPDKFKYHCVVNGKRTAFVEVCAPERRMNGFCAEFNILGARIQDQYRTECKPSCPDHYQSTEAYKYGECYNLTFDEISTAPNTFPNTPELNEDTQELQEDTQESKKLLITILSLVILIILLFPVVIGVILKRTKEKRICRTMESEMDMLNT